MWIERLARLGYATKGILYGLIGILAVMTTIEGGGGRTTGTEGVLTTILSQPFGQILLTLIAIGLIGYALWRLVEAIFDPEHAKTDAKNIAKRLGYAFSGIVYGGLALNAIRLLTSFGGSGGGSGNSKQAWTARLLQQPFGQWLVALVGALVIGFGFYRFYRAYKIKFRRKLNLSELSAQQQKWVVNISRAGISARALVFVILGFFLLQAARQAEAGEVKGLSGILDTLAAQPFGQILLAVVALGLVGYGIYMLVQARYRQIPA